MGPRSQLFDWLIRSPRRHGSSCSSTPFPLSNFDFPISSGLPPRTVSQFRPIQPRKSGSYSHDSGNANKSSLARPSESRFLLNEAGPVLLPSFPPNCSGGCRHAMPKPGIARWKRTHSRDDSMRSTRAPNRRTPGNPKCRSMISSTKASFRKRFEKLPPAIRQAAVENYRRWQQGPWEPSLHFKKVGNYGRCGLAMDSGRSPPRAESASSGSGSARTMGIYG